MHELAAHLLNLADDLEKMYTDELFSNDLSDNFQGESHEVYVYLQALNSIQQATYQLKQSRQILLQNNENR